VYPNAAGTWVLARMGPPGSYNSDPAKRAGYPGVKFPLAAFDELMKQRVPSWGGAEVAATQKALALLIDRICPCVLIAHSSGGPYAQYAALNAAEKIKAVVVLEPAGAPDPQKAEPAKAKKVPHLFLWGDFLSNDPIQNKAMPPVKAWRDALASAGAQSDWVELPKIGITGNTHVMMMDTNSDAVADVVQAWFVKQRLMK
jgi:pimeloyl-ACP methyl ester carboxylesterase